MRKTCTIFNADNAYVGAITFGQNPLFKIWKIKYITSDLPIPSDALPSEVKQIITSKGWHYAWRRT
ncbi:hypothetical protein OE749_10745 [Aestuariibacter sp. AA17]|uniref:Uncharacterized protein n=1 Tax=Fluctibacter corallii TaxID=2984329 RepID=A0ABT3A923_9ALTE|nr:hypothetical protein [Aestuariibacter sp. AA17]MCV2885168.1 hypothetical protein [Aestuariibacter sp. AA17]